MKIVVSSNYEAPIYEQIKLQILRAILTSELLPGCFVAEKSSDLIKQHLIDEATEKMEQAISAAKKAGNSDEDILALFNQCLRRINNG